MFLRPEVHCHELKSLNPTLSGIACETCGWYSHGDRDPVQSALHNILRAAKEEAIMQRLRVEIIEETLTEAFGWHVCTSCGAWIRDAKMGAALDGVAFCVSCLAGNDGIEIPNTPKNQVAVACWLDKSRAIRPENYHTPLLNAAVALVEMVPEAMGMPILWKGESPPISPSELDWNITALKNPSLGREVRKPKAAVEARNRLCLTNK